MHNYTQLNIWKLAMELAKDVYLATKSLPREETYGLISQMQRAAVSVPSNIAEGSGRSTDKEFAHFLSISLGSLFELNTQVLLAESFGYINKVQSGTLQMKAESLQKMIYSFKQSIDSEQKKS